MQNIIIVAKNQRKLRLREARKAGPQYSTFIEYTADELKQILKEVWEDDYLLEIPALM